MKYVFRRALFGLVLVPLVAFAWVLFTGVLSVITTLPMGSVNRVWNEGLGLGILATVMFAIIPLILKEKR
jgi:hypothetical protein